MPKQRSTRDEPLSSPTRLKVERADAEQRLRARIEIGRELERRQISSFEELGRSEADRDKWVRYNRDMLASLVNSNAYSDEHVSAGVIMAGVFASTRDLDREVRDHKHEVREKIGQLESVLERLELLEDFDPLTDMLNRSFGAQTARSGARPALPRSRNHEPGAQPPPSRLTDVFIVHGHDRQARAELARFVERVGLKPIILEEQADAGLTIVEKFERDASRAGAAIVLLTPDDVGGTKDTSPPELRGRARQNVIFELGYFAGKFGRGRVCALVRGHLEIPSDYNGVMYVTMDDHDGWKLKLARNLKDSGLPVDLSRLL